MPDISSNGLPQDSPNGQPDSIPNSVAAPRIAPPEGTRAARGQFVENDENVSSDETLENEKIEADLAESDLTVADVPAVEDAYGFEDSYATSNFNPGLPPDSTSNYDDPPGFLNGKARPDTPKDVEQGLMAHLGELRQRLLYCAIILMAGMTLTWNYSKQLQTWFADPIIQALGDKGTLISINPTGFFSITVQFSLISALIITAPLLFWQVWLFIEPALTKSERRYSLIVLPFSSALFFTGAGISYAVSPLFFKFFLAFQPVGIAANWDYMESILLMAKMLLAFGLMFQVPVVVIFLNKLGLLSRNVLIEYWRHAVVLIFILAAVVTPTWDPVTLAICAGPPCLLYLLSIWLVKWL